MTDISRIRSAKRESAKPSRIRPVERERDTNIATVRVLRVLSMFGTVAPSFGVTEISERLGMTKNMAFRALSTLADQGYLMRTPEGRYELGFRVIELLNPNMKDPDLRVIARPFINQLHAISGETVRLVLRTMDAVVIIDGIEASGPRVSRRGLGASFPLHIGPVARAVLCALPDDEITAYLKRNAPLKAVTPASITDPRKIWKEVALVRERGYALGYGDLTPGILSIAFPIYDGDKTVWGSIGTGGPIERFSPERLQALLPQLTSVANELNWRTQLYCANPA